MKKHLDEIDFIRPILICLYLVGFHSFAPFGGGWEMPCFDDGSGVGVVPYYWLDKYLYSFMLETFVFISGYVFAYQIQTLKRDYTFKTLLYNKFKRLIIPSVVFSILYSFFFYDKPFNLLAYTYDIINGLGHLWFLPMLFWCFIFTWIINKIKICEEIKLIALLLLSVFSIFPFPLQFKETCYYLFFFYLSTYVYSNKKVIISRFANLYVIFITFGLYLLSFLIFTPIREGVFDDSTGALIDTLYRLIIYKSTRLAYSLSGLISIYLFTLYLLKNGFRVPAFLKKLGPLCMGIYIFHQFVLKYLYYKTSLPQLLGKYSFPWIGFLITLLLCIIASWAFRKTRMGRNLI